MASAPYRSHADLETPKDTGPTSSCHPQVSKPPETGGGRASGFQREPFIAVSNAKPYASRMAQLVTRVDDDLAAAVDGLVAAGVVASRSEAVRLGLERLVDRFRRDEIGARIANGYRARPQSEAEVAWADESSVRMIAEEPW